MKVKPFIFMTLIVIAACKPTSFSTPSQGSTSTRPSNVSSPTPPPRRTLVPTGTPSPLPTYTPSVTPIASITPQPGFDIWDAGSVIGSYTVQYPIDRWVENLSSLTHKTLPGCSIGLHGGSDICMSGGCKQTGVILGDAGFSKTMVGENFSIYVSTAVRSWISYDIRTREQPKQCMQEGEEVISTILLRPEKGCSDRAEFVGDITIPDNSSIPAISTFTKTWRIKNIGTCTWTREYSVYLVGRVPGGDFYQISYLEEDVLPDETVDISVELTAPSVPGIARWEWMLQNEFQDLFGVGKRTYTQMPGEPFWAQVNVLPASTP